MHCKMTKLRYSDITQGESKDWIGIMGKWE